LIIYYALKLLRNNKKCVRFNKFFPIIELINMSSVKVKSTKSTKSKATKKSVEETPVVESQSPVVEVPVEETPVVEAPVEETPVVEEPVVEAPVVEETMRQRFERLIKVRQEHILELKKEIQELRKMQKDHEVEVKNASKKGKKKKSQSEDGVPRKPSGFASPVIVSDKLYEFLAQYGVKNGDPIARTDVTRHITSYIKEHDLQNPEHRREIVPDATLLDLFGPALELKDPNDPSSPKVWTYLKLQKYLSPHFPKKQ
jgi:chromatin remodeling complex protein RSC6